LYIDARGTAVAPPSSQILKARIYYVLMAIRGAKLAQAEKRNRTPSDIAESNVYVMTGRIDVDFFGKRFIPKKFAIKIVDLCRHIHTYSKCKIVTYLGTGTHNPQHEERYRRTTLLQNFGHSGLMIPKYMHHFNADLNLREYNYDAENNWTHHTAIERYYALFHYICKNSPLQPVSLPAIPEA
jgi:hypothetical protein